MIKFRSPIQRRRPHHQTQVITKLTSGFKRFHKRWYQEEKLYQNLRHGQNPHALLIACSDSRVDPAILTDSLPGDIFVIRNVANLVPPYTKDQGFHGVSAAIEYAVKHLKVKDIIVMGHASCGGIKALVEEGQGEHHTEEKDEFIGPWVAIAKKAWEQVQASLPFAPKEDQIHACELLSVRLSLESLKTFPWVKSRLKKGELTLHGWYFDLKTGELLEYDEEREVFHPLISLGN
ncbi:MAG: carbonic anhydrase [Desulfovibrionaceae bacterium]|nr:carbonic anhydrase [Desulfovibrionaceae bacterium]